MRSFVSTAVLVCLCGISIATRKAQAQTTIYFKRDHIYAGGKEIATVSPAPTDQTAPTAPTGLASSNVTATSVQLSWGASTDTGGSNLAGYKVYRQMGTGASLPVGTVGASTLTFVDQGPLVPSTAYTFTVRAFDSAQNHSAASTGVNVTTSAINDTTAPAAPTNLTGYLVTRNSVRLNWNRSIDAGGSGIAGYKIYRGGTLISGPNPITSLTYDDSGLSYKTAYAYTITAIDNANNTSAATSAFNITTDRELLAQDNFSRLDAALTSPWTVNLGSAGYNNYFGLVTVPTSLAVSSLRLGAAVAYQKLMYYECNEVECQEAFFAPANVWSQAAISTTATSIRASVDVVTNTSAGGLIFYAQAATGIYYGQSYSSSRAFRALLQGGSVTLQNCSDIFYLDPASAVCSTVGSAGSVPATGTLSIETNANTGSVNVYVNGTLKITATVSTSLMSGSVGASSLGYYDYDGQGNATTYHTSVLDNFILERN
jgi:chitodextrinase